jgi:hypothetical protein
MSGCEERWQGYGSARCTRSRLDIAVLRCRSYVGCLRCVHGFQVGTASVLAETKVVVVKASII